MKHDLLLIDLAQEIRAHRFETLKAMAIRLGSSERFVRHKLKPVLILLGYVTAAEWDTRFPRKFRAQ